MIEGQEQAAPARGEEFKQWLHTTVAGIKKTIPVSEGGEGLLERFDVDFGSDGSAVVRPEDAAELLDGFVERFSEAYPDVIESALS